MSADPAPPVAAAVEPAPGTKERLLDAAERLFAERGFRGASLRAVTRAAGASVSAANYHFGSKEALLRAVLRRRVEPVNRRRLELLDALEARSAGGAPPSAEEVLRVFLQPLFEERAHSADATRRRFREVAARLYADPPELVAPLKAELFGPLSARFTAALCRSLPEHAPEAVELGFHFSVGSMIHVAGGHLEEALADGRREPPGDDALLSALAAFCAAGLRGRPPTSHPPGPPGRT